VLIADAGLFSDLRKVVTVEIDKAGPGRIRNIHVDGNPARRRRQARRTGGMLFAV
jgi:hypothetical protein